MEIVQRLAALRELMKERGIDVYVVPTSDFHETEYVGEYFKARTYMSGFTGSSGTLVVCLDKAGLWTDGRYFIQAAHELENTSIELMKSGEEGTPLMAQYIYDNVRVNKAIGFDGRVINTRLAEAFKTKIKDKDAKILYDEDLVGMIWKDRPALANEKAFAFDVAYCGKSSGEKLQELRTKMQESGCDTHLISSLDDIAWLLNMRGHDVPSFPVVMAFLLVRLDGADLYVEQGKLDDILRAQFAQDKIVIHDYDAIYQEVQSLSKDAVVMLDKTTINYKMIANLPEGVTLKDRKNPSQLWKAIKNDVELANNRHAHIKDAVAMVNFMYWLKHEIKHSTITECSAADYLLECRKAQDDFLEVSFDTISGYNENGAMMHYHAMEESCATLKPEGFLLVDSGGQYIDGTTDITRTFALGPITQEMKMHFTTVLRSMIRLASANFLYGCTGLNLDILARGPIWNLQLDYKCGTGHGIGYLLNVHEAPNGFRWRKVAERSDGAVLEAGMITTDEPGVYLEGKYGIRHENELITRKGMKNEYGQFMNFETITFVPFDLDAIDPQYLTYEEKAWLNAYHKETYEKVSPFVREEVKTWLKEYTREI